MKENKLLDAHEYAILTGLSYQTVLNYAYAGVIPHKLVKRHCFFTWDSLALGLTLNAKSRITDYYLDFYFVGSGLPRVEERTQHFLFEHGNAISFSELCDKIISEYEVNFKAYETGYNQEIITLCKPKIEAAKQDDLEEFDRRWKKRFPDGGDKYSYNLKRERILDNYKMRGNELGKKVESILDNCIFDGIRKKVMQDGLKTHTKHGVITSYEYKTTTDDFNIADFIEQIIRASKTKRYTEVNVCIFGKVPEYVNDICKRLESMGGLTALIYKEV